MKYRVYLTQIIVMDTEDESEQEAIKWAETHPELGRVERASATAVCKVREMEEGEDGDDEIDHRAVEARCESCSKPILEGDDYSVAGEDCYALCPPCGESARQAFKEHVARGLCGYCGLHPHLEGREHCKGCDPDA